MSHCPIEPMAWYLLSSKRFTWPFGMLLRPEMLDSQLSSRCCMCPCTGMY